MEEEISGGMRRECQGRIAIRPYFGELGNIQLFHLGIQIGNDKASGKVPDAAEEISKPQEFRLTIFDLDQNLFRQFSGISS